MLLLLTADDCTPDTAPPRPQRFMQLVERHPNIKVWFSGHFHLSQNYADSISVVGSCAFVQTGVIGECNRDGNRWVLEGLASAYTECIP